MITLIKLLKVLSITYPKFIMLLYEVNKYIIQ